MLGGRGRGGAHTIGGPSAVRLLDEHDHRVVLLKLEALLQQSSPAPAQASGRLAHRPRRWLGVLAWVLIALGTLALADAVVTLVWQEPFSALYAKLRQDHLGGVLRSEERAPPTAAEQRALATLTSDPARIAFLAASLQRRAPEGAPVGRIRIPRIGANFVVVDGTGTEALESGPGIYPETRFPGQGATTAIAGHRTTYLAPFRHIDELHPGNSILLQMPYASFTYRVTGSAVVAPTDVHAAVANLGYPRLVLSACTPLFSAEKRLLVFARLQRASLAGSTRTAGASSSAVTSGARTRAVPARLRRGPAALRPALQLVPPLSS